MWFPTGMVVADFTVEISGFGNPAAAYPLVRRVAEVMGRLGIDHLLVDLNREGDVGWMTAFRRDPIVITGSAQRMDGLRDEVGRVARSLLPGAAVRVDWREHDPRRGAAMEYDRQVERVSRVFGGITGGAVAERVRLAILDAPSYHATYGMRESAVNSSVFGCHAVNALCQALRDFGPRLGLDWATDASRVRGIVDDLCAAGIGAEGTVSTWPTDSSDPVDRMAGAEFADPLMAECADYLHAAMFDAIRDALTSGFVGDMAVEDPVMVDGGGVPRDWAGELIASTPGRRVLMMDPIEG